MFRTTVKFMIFKNLHPRIIYVQHKHLNSKTSILQAYNAIKKIRSITFSFLISNFVSDALTLHRQCKKQKKHNN